MKTINLLYCDLLFKETHAILTMHENSKLTLNISNEITNHLDNHYKGKNFVFITDRKYPHEIDLAVYKGRILKNMIGFAIVSNNPEEMKRASKERELWNESFTFFKELSEAENWACSFFD